MITSLYLCGVVFFFLLTIIELRSSPPPRNELGQDLACAVFLAVIWPSILLAVLISPRK